MWEKRITVSESAYKEEWEIARDNKHKQLILEEFFLKVKENSMNKSKLFKLSALNYLIQEVEVKLKEID